MCMCARARARADPIMMVFVPGVEYGFLRVYNVTWEFFEGMYLNIVVIIMGFVASVTLSFLINVVFLFCFVRSYCKARCADCC